MRYALCLLIAAACSSGRAERAPEDTPERRAYEKAKAAHTPEALRAYFEGFPPSARRNEIIALYRALAEQSLREACSADTVRAYEKHLEGFPDDRHRVADALLRAHGREGKEVPRTARTVRLVFDYRELGQQKELPESIADDMRELLGYAGLRVVDGEQADLVVTLKGEATVQGQAYTGGYFLENAHARFGGWLELRHASGLEHRERLDGHVSSAFDPMQVSGADEHKRLHGRARAAEGIHAAGCREALVRIVWKMYGAEPVAKALASPSVPLAEAARLQLWANRSSVRRIVAPYLRHEDPEVRKRAAGLVEPSIDPADDELSRLTIYLHGSWFTARPVPARGFTQASLPRAKAALLAPLGPQERAAMLLGTLGQPGLDVLMATLEDAYMPRAVLWALARMGEPAERALVGMLDHEGRIARLHAAQALGLIGAEGALERLRVLARRDPFGPVQQAAALAIEQIELTPILERLRDVNPQTRAEAAKQLMGVRDPRVFAPLFRALKEGACRTAAIETLGVLGDRRALEELREMKKNQAFRLGAAEAIGRIEAYGG